MERIINKKQINKKLLTIALPIAIQGVVSATLGMIDDLMVGFLGETELAAVGVGTQLTMIHYMLIFGMISGTATFMAQFYGSGDMSSIRKCVGFSITVLTATGIAFFIAAYFFAEDILSLYTKDEEVIILAADYLRTLSPQFIFLAFAAPAEMSFKATQQTKVPMIVSAIVFSTNTFFNYVLIFGKFGAPALGVKGAAIATAFARLLQVMIDLLYLKSKRNIFSGNLKSYFGWKNELVKRIIKNSAPTTLNEVLWALGQTMFAAAFNRIGTTDYAAYQAANSISNILAFGAFSIGDASLIMVGQKLGENKKEEAWGISRHLLKIGVIAGFVTGMIILITASPASNLFKLTEVGQQYTMLVLLVIGFTQPLSLYNGMQVVGILRGGGDTRFAMIAESSCVWLVAVPIAFAAALIWHLPIYIAFLLTRIEDVVKCVILTWRYMSRKWMNIVIEGIGSDTKA